jgi:hypothetical protein
MMLNELYQREKLENRSVLAFALETLCALRLKFKKKLSEEELRFVDEAINRGADRLSHINMQ